MSINHLIDDTANPKYDVYVKKVEADEVESSKVTTTNVVDLSSWVSNVSEPDTPLKDLIYGWTGLTEGTSRSSIGHFYQTRSKLLPPSNKASVFHLKGQFSTIVLANPVWSVLMPTGNNNTYGTQSFVYQKIEAIDLTNGDEHLGLFTELNVSPSTAKMTFTDLVGSVGHQIRVTYEYIVTQEIP